MSWWDLGEGSGYPHGLPTYRIACAFCGVEGNFETVHHQEKAKPGDKDKKLNYDTFKCGECGNLMFVLWSTSSGYGSKLTAYRTLPWHRSTRRHPEHWPEDVGRYWVEARRSIEGENWTAAALMARSAIQLVMRKHDAKGANLKQEIDDLASRGLLIPTMQEWSHEVRELANEGTHPQPGTTGTAERDARDVVEFLSFLMQVLYDVPHSIEQFRERKS